jgi:type II restriction enzyme
MNYNKQDLRVKDFLMVPKYFFSPKIIEKRKPLSDTERRAGWVGCNIVLKEIPEEGRIFIIKNEMEITKEEIISNVRKTEFIKQYKLDARGWVLDVLNCVNGIKERDFTLEQMYKFEGFLAKKYPNNNHIKDKIRQQLQILRDKEIIEFRGKGKCRKI